MGRPTPPSADKTGPLRRRRGRPRKFNGPTQVVALTLPDDVVDGLRKIDDDLAWAVVTLFEKRPEEAARVARARPNAELVRIAGQRSLIVINRAVFKSLPGVNIIPLSGDRAFLALEPGRGMSDLELAVHDRLADDNTDRCERDALTAFRSQLREWRCAPGTRSYTRAIIVVEQLKRPQPHREDHVRA
jgi:hypothetical protein